MTAAGKVMAVKVGFRLGTRRKGKGGLIRRSSIWIKIITQIIFQIKKI